MKWWWKNPKLLVNITITLVYLQGMWAIVPDNVVPDIPNENEKYEAKAVSRPMCSG